MSLKTLAQRASATVGKQVLVAKKNSPVVLVGVGIVGFGATVVLACRATLKLSDVLAEGEEHLKKVEVTVKEGEEEVKKAGFNVRLQTAIKVARLYAPAAAAGAVTIAAFTSSHVILSKQNAGLAAAYAVVHQGFSEYRARVRHELGDEKDLEFRFGVTERTIAEEGPNGIETKVIRGLDQNAIKESEKRSYARVFDQSNPNWSNVPHQNQYFVQMVMNHARDALQINGVVLLNDVYDQLGFKRTKAGAEVGWVKQKRIHPVTGEENDTFIDFGVWSNGVYKGKEWVNGDPGAFLLDFNVDGTVLDLLDEM